MHKSYEITISDNLFSYIKDFTNLCGYTVLYDDIYSEEFERLILKNNSILGILIILKSGKDVLISYADDYVRELDTSYTNQTCYINPIKRFYSIDYSYIDSLYLGIVQTGTLYCNYNDGNLMLSVVKNNIERNTEIAFVTKLDNAEKTVVVGGNYVTQIEGNTAYSIFNGEMVPNGVPKISFLLSNSRNFLDFFMRIDMETSKNKWASTLSYTDDSKNDGLTLLTPFSTKRYHKLSQVGYSNSFLGKLFTYKTISISYDDIPVINYKYLVSNNNLDRGKSVNYLNCISLVMPLFFCVIREPKALNNFSYIGSTNIVNYVNMRNMSSGSLNSIDYPVNASEYNCFTVGKRRSSPYIDIYDYIDRTKLDESVVRTTINYDGFITSSPDDNKWVGGSWLKNATIRDVIHYKWEENEDWVRNRFSYHTQVCGYTGLAFRQEDD